MVFPTTNGIPQQSAVTGDVVSEQHVSSHPRCKDERRENIDLFWTKIYVIDVREKQSDPLYYIEWAAW